MKRIALGIVVLALGAIALYLATTRGRAPHGPVLVYRAGPVPAGSALPKANDDRAMALALASLTVEERRQAAAAMDYAAVRIEGSLMPGGEDLGEGDPLVELRKTLAHYSPVINAARAFEQGSERSWIGADLSVRVAESCPKTLAKNEACTPVWSAKDAPGDAARARFLAWSITKAVVLELPSADARTHCAEALRTSRQRDESALALVLTDADLRLEAIPERDEVRKSARRLGGAMAVAKREDNQKLDALGRAAPTGRVAPWLSIGPNALLVVPRLSALVAIAGLDGEIRSACPDARATNR